MKKAYKKPVQNLGMLDPKNQAHPVMKIRPSTPLIAKGGGSKRQKPYNKPKQNLEKFFKQKSSKVQYMFENSNYPFYDIPASAGDATSQLICGLRILIRGYRGPLIRVTSLPTNGVNRVWQDIYPNSAGYVDNDIVTAFARRFTGYAFIDRVYNQSANAGDQGYMYFQENGGDAEGATGRTGRSLYAHNFGGGASIVPTVGGKSYIPLWNTPFPGGTQGWFIWNRIASSAGLDHTFSSVLGPVANTVAGDNATPIAYNPSPFDDKPGDPQHISCYVDVISDPRWDVGSTPMSVSVPLAVPPNPNTKTLGYSEIQTVQDRKAYPVAGQRQLSVYKNGVLAGQTTLVQTGTNISAHTFGPVVVGSLNYGANGHNQYSFAEFAYWHKNPEWIGRVMAAQKTAHGL